MERTLVKSENMGTTFIQNPKMGGATVRAEGQKLIAFYEGVLEVKQRVRPEGGQKFIAQWQAK